MLRIGEGWDIHKLVQGAPLKIGGITVPSAKGESAHSDGDVLLHAIIDAIFGAFADGDIGSHFPDTDPSYKDCNSMVLLYKTLALHPFVLANLDCTILLQEPKLQPFILSIRQKLATALKVPTSSISVKAKTAEHIGAVGAGDAIIAKAVILLESK
ncbi:MAG: 2-C-methyl-D-erythritol 2,4-cyclodiphosphate synthase [Spirochaetia bacterium]|jgi:2-C-methyl-D-erythritol 2,4-cyclodiphosphate synthase|nr:2-C-methyl-D-erythritol 2,4-cyclodiphosphate synthase [Spirochaetia bacterium]